MCDVNLFSFIYY